MGAIKPIVYARFTPISIFPLKGEEGLGDRQAGYTSVSAAGSRP